MRDEELFEDDGRYEPPSPSWLGLLAWLAAGAGVAGLVIGVLWLTARAG